MSEKDDENELGKAPENEWEQAEGQGQDEPLGVDPNDEKILGELRQKYKEFFDGEKPYVRHSDFSNDSEVAMPSHQLRFRVLTLQVSALSNLVYFSYNYLNGEAPSDDKMKEFMKKTTVVLHNAACSGVGYAGAAKVICEIVRDDFNLDFTKPDIEKLGFFGQFINEHFQARIDVIRKAQRDVVKLDDEDDEVGEFFDKFISRCFRAHVFRQVMAVVRGYANNERAERDEARKKAMEEAKEGDQIPMELPGEVSTTYHMAMFTDCLEVSNVIWLYYGIRNFKKNHNLDDVLHRVRDKSTFQGKDAYFQKIDDIYEMIETTVAPLIEDGGDTEFFKNFVAEADDPRYFTMAYFLSVAHFDVVLDNEHIKRALLEIVDLQDENVLNFVLNLTPEQGFNEIPDADKAKFMEENLADEVDMIEINFGTILDSMEEFYMLYPEA